jgi:hypothetical protein
MGCGGNAALKTPAFHPPYREEIDRPKPKILNTIFRQFLRIRRQESRVSSSGVRQRRGRHRAGLRPGSRSLERADAFADSDRHVAGVRDIAKTEALSDPLFQIETQLSERKHVPELRHGVHAGEVLKVHLPGFGMEQRCLIDDHHVIVRDDHGVEAPIDIRGDDAGQNKGQPDYRESYQHSGQRQLKILGADGKQYQQDGKKDLADNPHEKEERMIANDKQLPLAGGQIGSRGFLDVRLQCKNTHEIMIPDCQALTVEIVPIFENFFETNDLFSSFCYESGDMYKSET